MSGHWLALYTFAQFRSRADDPANNDFFSDEPAVWAAMERADGFIARSGYDGDPGPESWGDQVFPKYWTDNGDGWAPSTISLWQDLESALAAVYLGPHVELLRLGHLFVKETEDYPPYVLWWVPIDHQPDWSEAVERHELLGDVGPTAEAFTFKTAFRPDGRATTVDARRSRDIAGRNRLRSDLPKSVQ
ncbi:MAG: DUF3291 domain-containing protein [Pseudomonadota bacterium]